MTATAPSKPADSAPNQWKPELHEIPLASIETADNVRSDVGDVVELAASIEKHGVLQPVQVEEIGAGRYGLIFGHRRLAAAKYIGLATIPAIVEPAGQGAIAIRQLIENLQREDLNALDTAKAYRTLLDAGLTQRQLAEEIGISQPTIANTLALLRAPEELQAKVASGELTRSHVEAIVKLPKAEQKEVARRVVEHSLSVDDIQREVNLAAQRASAEDRRRDETRTLADKAEAQLAKKKIGNTRETALLRVFDSELEAELKKRGWTVKSTANYYGAPKGCDCPGWSVQRNYMGNQTPITLTAQCFDNKHVKAANDAAETERAARRAELEAEEQAEREAHAKELEPIVERLTVDPKLRARVTLWALSSWDVVDGFTEATGGWPLTLEKLAKLTDVDVDRWLIVHLAEQASETEDVAKEILAPAKPKRGAKAKA